MKLFNRNKKNNFNNVIYDFYYNCWVRVIDNNTREIIDSYFEDDVKLLHISPFGVYSFGVFPNGEIIQEYMLSLLKKYHYSSCALQISDKGGAISFYLS